MADLFSRQQLASAQNASARMTDIISQIEKNIALLSYLDIDGKVISQENYQELNNLYALWGDTIDSVIYFNDREKMKRILPKSDAPAVDLTRHFQLLKHSQRQYVDLAISDRLPKGTVPQKQDLYLIWGYPLWRNNNVFAGAWMVS